MRRYLDEPLRKDIKEKIVILSGPRQVGKTTLSRQLVPSFVYLNFDSSEDRKIIKRQEWDTKTDLLIFDELHKMKNWKSWIKGIYDTGGIPPGILITGSARLEALRRGGDSLAGRFYAFRLHPLTVKEICDVLGETPREALDRLLKFGGFPEPYLRKDEIAAKRWRRTHVDTIIREDLLDLEKVRDIKSIEILIDLLRSRVGSTTSFNALAEDLHVSIHTVKHWIQILENLCVVFAVRPYHRNISRSLLKEPKYYFYDTGAVDGTIGAKLENTVALALLRDLHVLEDTTGSRVALHYLRDKEKNEVDFLTIVDGKPTLMVEVKAGDDSFSPPLFRFGARVPQAKLYQVVHDLRRRKSSGVVQMLSAHDFLNEFELKAKV